MRSVYRYHLFDQYPLLWLLLPFVLGIVGAEALAWHTDWAPYGWGVSGMALLTAALVRKRREQRGIFFFLLFLGCVAMGAGRYLAQAQRQKVVNEEKRLWIVDVDAPPRKTEKGVQCEGLTTEGGRMRVFLSPPCTAEIGVGTRLWLYTAVQPLAETPNPGGFDETAYLHRRGIIGKAYCGEGEWRTAGQAADFSLRLAALRWRERLSSEYAHCLSGDTLALVAAATIGEKQWLRPQLRHLFSVSGTSHLLALSGLHIGILYMLYQGLLLRGCRRRWWRVVATLGGVLLLWGYALLAGLPLSLVRACTMFTLASGAGLWRKEVFSLHHLCGAVFAILLFSPTAVFDVGFQLSCLSVASILLLVPLFPRFSLLDSLALSRALYDSLAVTLAAQIGTLPLVIYSFHIFPLYGALANLLLVPLVAVMIVLSFVLLLVPFGKSLIAAGVSGVAACIFSLLRTIAELPCAFFRPSLSGLGVWLCYVVVAFGVAFVVRRKLFFLLLAILGALSLWGVEGWLYRPPTARIVFYNLYQSAAFHYVSDSGHPYFWTTDETGKTVDTRHYLPSFWEKERLAAPQSLFPDYMDNHVRYASPLFFSPHCRVAVADSSLSYTKEEKALSVDYLLVTKGFRGGVYLLQQWFCPKVMVLDPRLSSSYRQRLSEEGTALGWQIHDLKEKGALVVSFEEKK